MRPLFACAALGLVLAVGGPLLYQLLRGKPQPFVKPLSLDDSKREMKSKPVLIVGGTKGIGRALADELAQLGAKVTVSGRSIEDNKDQHLEFVKSDVSTVKGAHRLVTEQLKGSTFDTVVFTVGILTYPTLKRNEEGVEVDLATSYLSRFVITNDLIQTKSLVGRKRVFVMGFPGADLQPTDIEDMNFERTPYSPIPAHLNTVVMNEALVFELARRYPDLHVFGLNPGLIQTDIRKNFYEGGQLRQTLGKLTEFAMSLTLQSAEHFAKNVLVPLMVAPELNDKTAINFENDGSQCKVHSWMSDEKNRRRAWEVSEQLVKKALQ